MSAQVRIVLQARLTSTRLPGKVLLPIAGIPLVVLAALRASQGRYEAVVATSQEQDDDAIASECGRWSIPVVRGDLEDPLGRFVLAARGLADHDVVVRLTADNVFPDANLIALLVDRVSAQNGYARIGGADRALPYGVSAEAMTAGILRRADAAATSASDREHVTPWIRRATSDQVVRPPFVDPSWRGTRCTIDNLDDYSTIARLFADIEDPVRCPWQKLAERLPEPGAPSFDAQARTTLTLGGAQLGLNYGAANTIGMPSSETSVKILRTAAAHGFTNVDTARAYGKSERRIGEAMRRGLTERLRIITKVRPLDDVPYDADPRWVAECLDASVTASRYELRDADIDTLLTHRAADWYRRGARERMMQLRADSTVRRIGVSLSSPDELRTALDEPDINYIQLPFNLLDHRWLRPGVQSALRARPDVTIAARSAFLQGLIVGVPDSRWPDTEISQSKLRAVIEPLVHRFGRESSVDLALAYVRSQSWISTVVLGADSVEQVADLARLWGNPNLTEVEIADIHETIGQQFDPLLDPSRWVARG